LLHQAAADIDVVDGNQQHKGHDRVLGDACQHLRVADAQVATPGQYRLPHEAGEVKAEHQNQQCHQHLRQEQQHAAQQLGDLRQTKAIESDDERAQQHQAVDEPTDKVRRVAFGATLLQESVDPGAIGEHMKVEGPQGLHRAEAQCLGHQPAGQDHRECHTQARQEGTNLHEECTQGFNGDVQVVHGFSSQGQTVPWRAMRVSIAAHAVAASAPWCRSTSPSSQTASSISNRFLSGSWAARAAASGHRPAAMPAVA
jgi:hypothetical protein